jgi:hypothetical protein
LSICWQLIRIHWEFVCCHQISYQSCKCTYHTLYYLLLFLIKRKRKREKYFDCMIIFITNKKKSEYEIQGQQKFSFLVHSIVNQFLQRKIVDIAWVVVYSSVMQFISLFFFFSSQYWSITLVVRVHSWWIKECFFFLQKMRKLANRYC